MKKIALLLTLSAALYLCAGESYSFHLISDLHLGPADTYHATRFKGNRQRADLSTPALKNMLSRICKNTPDTKFVIQLGDLIEGNTKGTAEHRKQIRSALDLLKESCPCPADRSSRCHHHQRFPAHRTAHCQGSSGREGRRSGQAFEASDRSRC